MLSALLAAVHLLSPAGHFPQHPTDSATVTVRVTGDDGAPLEAVVRAGTVRGISGAGGIVFRVAAGTHRLVVSAIGYRTDSLTVTVRGGDEALVTAVLTTEHGEELEEIRVQSTRTSRRLQDEPLRVEVLGREEIEEKLLMTPGDITMLLNETGGLRVQSTRPSLGGASVRIQGLRGRYTLLLADGLPLHGPVGGLGLLQIPPMDLAQVEVIKGAASALYGSTALGGVINLLSRRPDGARELLLNVTSFGGVDAVSWLASREDAPIGWTVLAGAHRQGRVDRDGDGWADLAGFERLALRPRVFLRDDAGRALFLTAGFTAEDRTGGTLDRATTPAGTAWKEGLQTLRMDGGLEGSALVAGTWLLRVRTSAAMLRHAHAFGPEEERDRHVTLFGEGTATRALGDRVVTVLGAGLQLDRYRHRDLPAFDFTHAVPGLFAQGEWTPGDAVTLALSARADHHDAYGTFLTPRLSALFRLSSAWSLRASAGTGWFGPTPLVEETEVTGLRRLAPLAGLVAERSIGGSIDVGGVLGPLEVNATLFGSILAHAIRLEELPAGDFSHRLVNADGATRTSGVDLVARYHEGPWHVTGTYTHVRGSEETETGGRRTVPLTPRHAAAVVGAWEREGASRIGFEVYYTGRQALEDNPYRTRGRAHVIVGALAERRFGRFRVFLNLENVTDARQTRFDPLVRRAPARDGQWTTGVWAPLEGRAVNGGFRMGW